MWIKPKNNDGGLRIGEMEKDCKCGEGTMRSLWEKFYKDSDGINIPICRNCGNLSVVNEKMGIYKCKYCADNADITTVPSSWVANVFFKESSALNAKITFELEKFMFTKKQQ